MLNLDSKTIAEIKSYNDPPNEVHKVMAGTYILLGESGSKVKVRATKNTFMELIGDSLKSHCFAWTLVLATVSSPFDSNAQGAQE